MKSPFYFILTLILSVCSWPQVFSQLSLPGLFADNMVLQRNAEVQFWGIASPSTTVSIQTPWNHYEGKTNPTGEWKITITTPDIQEAFSIIVCNQKDCLTINNILLGEVWLASGQSNMEMPLRGWLPNDPILNAEAEIQNAQNYPIRFFTVHKEVSTQPLTGLKGTWELPQAEHAANFSATAFFFAQELVQELNVPVGIIHSSWGGTPVESWIGEQGLRRTGYYTSILDQLPETEKRPAYNKLTASTPTALFNAMINPLIPYTIKGVIWYQGESNVGAEEKYEVIFKQMIKAWRKKWKYDFPFYFAQIAPFDYQNNLSPALRNAQLKVTTVPNTGMAVTLDIGNPKNIHPADKKSVGQRLAALAFENDYHITGKVGALQPESAVQNQNGIEITFDCNAAGGITYLESQKNELEISEDNIKFYPATVQAENCTLILSSSKIQKPRYVRHAWSDTATGAIYNHLNIPIATFYLEAEE